MLKFALAGNPNSGKTTLFNNLTGSTAHVGNWPGVTVDKKEGVYKKCAEPIAIVDLPGIYSLSPYTQEEIIARNYILDEKPDCVINIIDATNLERNLYLTTQIMEIDVPVILALNMIDAVEKRGDSIDANELERRLGVPVVKISALKNIGLDKLMERAYETSKVKREGDTVIENIALKHLIGDIKIALDGQGVLNPMFHAVKLAELDEVEVLMHKDTVNMVEAFKKTHNDETFGDDFEALIADARYKYITKYFSPTLKRKNKEKFTVTPSDKADKVLTHKIWGIPIFLVVLFTIFHLTFSENLFFLGKLICENWVSLEGTAFEGVFGSGGINSPGVMLMNLMEVLTGWISETVAIWLSSSPEWVSGIVCDGVLGGIFAIMGFLPQILILFMFFSILEDSGYMARIAFILDRALRKFGLSGRAFLPMIMGFGCSVPAMINTRTLADEKEKLATIRVIPFFSCGAKLPILTAVSGAIVASFGVGNVDFITYGMYVVGIVTALVTVILMRDTTLKGDTPPFIMELPAYHAPQIRNLIMLLWDKAKHFIKKAFTIILASTIVIWVISHFSFSWQYLSDAEMENSILGGIGQLIQPLFTPLGFGSQLKSFGWVFAVAAITGLIAKENVVSTLGTLAACIAGVIMDVEADGGVGAVSLMIASTGITFPALLSFIAFNMTTIPCFAAVAAARGE
ncbi:MAG: ferrous iron transporter B, partial [Clostridia bacterium]|nr:ferrous iron transporter B [Clostridia bacterium]